MKEITIWINQDIKMSPRKMAAQAVHAALYHFGISHWTVRVLGASKGKIIKNCKTIIKDAGKTEIKPGTITAGI